MHKMIFLNLPVRDLDASRTFFAALGYTFNEAYCDDNALCLELGESLFAMLLKREFFASFTPREVADATATTEVLVALSVSERADVDRLIEQAIAAGGTEAREPQDHGFMYGRAYADLDGHIWEIMWTDPQAA